MRGGAWCHPSVFPKAVCWRSSAMSSMEYDHCRKEVMWEPFWEGRELIIWYDAKRCCSWLTRMWMWCLQRWVTAKVAAPLTAVWGGNLGQTRGKHRSPAGFEAELPFQKGRAISSVHGFDLTHALLSVSFWQADVGAPRLCFPQAGPGGDMLLCCDWVALVLGFSEHGNLSCASQRSWLLWLDLAASQVCVWVRAARGLLEIQSCFLAQMWLTWSCAALQSSAVCL